MTGRLPEVAQVPDPVFVPRDAFEVTQVDERPLVARRIEPEHPDAPAARGVDDVVVLRVLVSAAGRPAAVHLLRRSAVDASFDAAAVAAVKQWTFSPARRRRAPVDCWLNVGVPFRADR